MGAIEEAILNELSPTTLKSYMKKAKEDKFANADEKYDKVQRANSSTYDRNPKFDPRIGSKNMKNIENRKSGIKRAKASLTKQNSNY